MPSVLFVAGDLSGDGHAAALARSVEANHPDWNLFAVGGSSLKSTGARMVGDTSNCSVIGIAPALLLVPRLLALQKAILTFLDSEKIDLAVLCDWGGFNGPLLKHLKARSIPVLYYFPPSSWRKGGTSGLGIVPLVTRVATPFAWSAEKLSNAGCRADWVGHPLLEDLGAARSRDALRQEFGIEPGTLAIALMPGSRALELKYIAPHLAKAAQLLQSELPANSFKFTVAVPSGAAVKVRSYFGGDINIVEGRALDVLLCADAAVVKSGTVTLEAAVAGTPQIVVYDTPGIMRLQGHLMGGRKKNPFIAMPNIVLERMAVSELLGPECTPDAIVRGLKPLLFDAQDREKMKQDYSEVRKALGAELALGATARTAQIVDEMLASPA